MPGSILLNGLLSRSINRGIYATLDPVSRWGPPQGRHVSPRSRGPARGRVGRPKDPVEGLGLGSGAEEIPGVMVGWVGGAGGLGGGVVGACRVRVGCH